MVKLTPVSLEQITIKIKGFYHNRIKRVIWVWIIVLSLVNSYILGFLSNYNNDFEQLKIMQDSNLLIKDVSIVGNTSKKGSIVASKNGTKYYFMHCSGVGRIKEENKVYFNSENDATAEKYEKASGCE